MVVSSPSKTSTVDETDEASETVALPTVTVASPETPLLMSSKPERRPVAKTFVNTAEELTVAVPLKRDEKRFVIVVSALPLRSRKVGLVVPPVIRKFVQVPDKYAARPPEAKTHSGPSRSR